MPTEVIVFPDVEDTIRQYLADELASRSDTATVHNSVPNQRPERFVLVPRIGGVRRNIVVDLPLIGFEAFATTFGQAHVLCQLVRGLVNALQGQTVAGVTFYDVTEVGGVAKFPDPVSNQPRYVYTAQLGCRGAAI